jgi:flagellar biosynthesis protein FliP
MARLARIAALATVPGIFAPAEAHAAVTGAVISTDVTRTAITLVLLAMLPSLIIAMTSFTRIVIVLAMVRHAFGMPETPPNSVLVSLALFLTIFSMSSTVTQLHNDAVSPFLDNQITLDEAMNRGAAPLRNFMLAQTRDRDIEAIYHISQTPLPETPDQVELLKLVPAFIINELRVSFTIGFVILLPFLLIDLVVAAILLSLGMMMVPPTTISLPVKLLLFVLIDGWSLIIAGVVGSFR